MDQFWEELPIKSSVKTEVTIVRIIYEKEDTMYGAYDVCDRYGRRGQIAGQFFVLPSLHGTYEVDGTVSAYKRKKQLFVKTAVHKDPKTEQQLRSYMEGFEGSILYADALFEMYGDQALNALRRHPEQVAKRLSEDFRKIETETVMGWHEKLLAEDAIKQAVGKLQEFGLSGRETRGILRKFGPALIATVMENIYLAVNVCQTLNFGRCDMLALTNGLQPDHPYRIQRLLLTQLANAVKDGHCYMSKGEALSKTQEFYWKINQKMLKDPNKKSRLSKEVRDMLRVALPDDIVEKNLEQLVSENRVIVEGDRCYEAGLYRAEQDVADIVSRIAQKGNPLAEDDAQLKQVIDIYLHQKGYILEPEQRRAVELALKSDGGLLIINGGPGCGKTFITNIILDLLESVYLKNGLTFAPLLLAPTGKAAKVLTSATKYDAVTIHRALGYTENDGFKKNPSDPFLETVIVIDETSMLDVHLGASLFRAIRPGTKVIMVGDTGQLPPIGPGYVLYDLVHSGKVNVCTLTAPKRQQEGSSLVKNASLLRNAQPMKSDQERRDFLIFGMENDQKSQSLIRKSFREMLKHENNKYAMDEIQVLTPLKNGPCGTVELNLLLQEAFNPLPPGEIQKEARQVSVMKNGKRVKKSVCFRKGDKVIHVKNDYRKKWYTLNSWGFDMTHGFLGIANGECGVVHDVEIVDDINETFTRVIVRYDDGYVFYDDDLDSLEHAYALTIHKSQGSQWPVVIVAIPASQKSGSHTEFISNNLIYTAISRPKQYGFIIGNAELIERAVELKMDGLRRTGLQERLVASFD